MNTKNKKHILLIKSAIQKIPSVDYAFLFGSVLKKTHGESDIDLMLGSAISDDDRIKLSLELEIKLGCAVDVVSFHQAVPEVALRAFAKGLHLIMNDRTKFKQDYLHCFYQCEDRKNLLAMRQQRLKMKYAQS